MSTEIAHAYISGPLRQAIFIEDGCSKILSLSEGGNPRVSRPNDLALFFDETVEFKPFEKASNGSVTIDIVRGALACEAKLHDALDATIGGMDRRFSDATKQRKIREANEFLSDPKASEFIEQRLFSAPPTELLNVENALQLASKCEADRVKEIYRVIAAKGPEIAQTKFAEVVRQAGLSGNDSISLRRQFYEAGVFRIAAAALTSAQPKKFQSIVFSLVQEEVFSTSTIAKRILFDFAKLISRDPASSAPPTGKARIKEKPISVFEEFDEKEEVVSLESIVDRVMSGRKRRNVVRRRGVEDALERIQREIDWIEQRLAQNDIGRAESGLKELISHQLEVSRPEDVVKTITSVANRAASHGHMRFADRCLNIAESMSVDDPFIPISRAWLFHLRGEDAKALSQYDSAIERFPKNAVGYTGRAETLRALGRLTDALSQYDAAIAQFPTEAVGYNGRAETLRALGRLTDALSQYDAAIERFPDYAVGYAGRAETLRALGRLTDALSQYDAAIERFPDYAVGYAGRAETLRALGRLTDALSQYDAAIAQFPTEVVGYNGRAETLRALGRLTDALSQYDAAIARFPANAFCYNGRAETLRALGRLTDALSQYDATIERFPTDAFGYTGRAETLRALGRLTDALSQYDAAIERFPTDIVGYNGRAETLRALGRLTDALSQYDAAIERFPTDAFGYTGRAETLRALGRLTDALSQYDAAIELFPTEAVAYNGRAETLRALGRLTDALSQYDAAIERFPANAFCYNGRAETLRALGRLTDALSQYDAAIELFPTEAVGYTGRAETLRALGRLPEALTQYDVAIARFPTDIVGYTGRAETLRALGRLPEALTQYDVAIERFPTEVVGYTGRAETLRALGRLTDALSQYDAAIERFPADGVSVRGRAFILILKKDYSQARQSLTRANLPVSHGYWVAENMLAIADLAEGNVDAAIARVGTGIEKCPFSEQKKYFLTTLAVARLRKSNQDKREIEKAEIDLENLRAGSSSPAERGVVLLLFAHAAAAKQNRMRAEQYINEARTVVSAEDFARKRVEREIVRRFQLFEPTPQTLPLAEEQKRDNAIFEAEVQLLAA